MPEALRASSTKQSARNSQGSRVNNRDRILQASLELFNERGAPAVSTNTIAAHLGISPGNLYYHFANKEQIIRELWSQVEVPFASIPDLLQASPLPPEGLANFFMSASDMVSRFRFFFRDIGDLLARDPEFADAYRHGVEWSRRHLVPLFHSLVKQGAMSAPAQRRDHERLCTIIQLILGNWVGFITQVRGTTTLTVADIAEGGLHAFLVIEPHLEPTYAKRARATLDRYVSGQRRTRIWTGRSEQETAS